MPITKKQNKLCLYCGVADHFTQNCDYFIPAMIQLELLYLPEEVTPVDTFYYPEALWYKGITRKGAC